MKILRHSLFALFLFAGSLFSQEYIDIESQIENDYGIDIIYDMAVQDTWSSVYYDICDSEEDLTRYMNILSDEISKYPYDYFELIGISQLVLGNNLAFSNQARAAIPDPYASTLYYSINGAYGAQDEIYLTHVFHHELHHCTEYSIWGDMYFDWDDWMLLNIDGFVYGDGGASTYADTVTDYYSPGHPAEGFVNLYSMSGDEEDRCEIVAFIMTDAESAQVLELCKTDARLDKKVEMLRELFNALTGVDILFPEE